MVTPRLVTLPDRVKWASFRLDCCGLASTSWAVGGAAGVGTPQPAVSTATTTARRTRRGCTLTFYHLRGRRRRDRESGVVLVEGEGEGIALLRDHVLERIAVTFPEPSV